MLDIGWSELLVVAVVAIIVVGPKDLPKLMRSIGFYAGKLRRTVADFRRQFDEAMAESEAEEVRKNIESIRRSMGPVDLKAPLDKPVMTPQAPQTPPSQPETPQPPPQPASVTPEPASPETAPAPKPANKAADTAADKAQAVPKPKVTDKPKSTAPKRRKTKTAANTEPKP
jgi:sec-independent protein translocase protein TatB